MKRKRKWQIKIPKGGTPLDDISGLKLKNVHTREELYGAEFDACSDATVDYLSGKKKIKEWTRLALIKLHQNMFGKIWAWAGKKRTSETNIGVPPHQIDEQAYRFFDDLRFWESQGMNPVEIAVRIHHRLVWIHPFPNGNGRWARLAANIYLHQKTKNLFRWPELAISQETQFRNRYLQALKEADQLHFGPLLQLHQELITTL